MEEEQNITDSDDIDKSNPEEQKQRTINAIVLVVGIIAVLAIILLSIKLFEPKTVDEMIQEIAEKGETKNGYVYNGFVFLYQEDLWHTQWQYTDTMLNLHFHYGPRDVESVPLIGSLDNSTDLKNFYLTFDPSEKNMSLISLASSELGLNLVKGMNVKLTAACSNNNSDACKGRPIITCDNTNESVIFIRTGETPIVVLDKNCITIKGPGNDLLKAVDKFLFRSYKIMIPD